MHGSDHDTTHDEKAVSLIDFSTKERIRDEVMAFLGLENREHFRKTYLKPLLDSGKIKMSIPDKPKSKNQRYLRADKWRKTRNHCIPIVAVQVIPGRF